MIVENIVINNLELLEDAYNNSINGNTKKDFGRRLPILLDHISIILTIRDVSLLEAMMLKKFSNSDIIEYNDNKSESVPNKKYKDMPMYISELSALNERIQNDNDVKVKPDKIIFPISEIKRTVVITFSGISVLNVIGSIDNLPTCIFKAANKDTYENFIISYFLKEFYNFMDNQIQYVDLASDAALHSKYLNSIGSKDKIILSQINTSFGTIDFLNQNTFASNLSKINSNKSNCNNNIYDLYELDYLDSIYFTCNTSLYTFFEIFLNSPIGSVLEFTDFKIIFSEKENYISYDDIDKYNRRLVTLYKLVYNARTSTQTNETRIDKFNYMIAAQKIKYTIKVKFSNLNKFVKSLEKYTEKEFIRTDFTYVYSYTEIRDIIDFIKKSSSALYNNFKK